MLRLSLGKFVFRDFLKVRLPFILATIVIWTLYVFIAVIGI